MQQRILRSTLILAIFATVFAFVHAQEMAGQDGVLERDGARIYYQVTGEGEPLLLIHGYPLSGELFSRDRETLSEQFQVITIDLRGYGQSEAPSSEATIETYAMDALAVMDELGVEQAIIGGMSMGGPIAFEMYRQAPERFRGLILIDTIAAAAAPPEAGLWRGVAELVEQQGVEALPPVLIKDMLTGETRVNQPEQVEFLTNLILQASQEAAIAGANALANRPDSTDTLAQIQVPTLILVGLADSLYPVAISQRMNEAIATSELVILDGGSHAAIYEVAEQANQAILEWAQGLQ